MAGRHTGIGRLPDERLVGPHVGWFLWPTGLALVGLALLDRPALPRLVQGVIVALAVRFGFVFLAVGAPGLFVAVVKRMIGRARPFVAGNDAFYIRKEKVIESRFAVATDHCGQ